MAKLWSSSSSDNSALAQMVEAFTVGEDYQLDQQLLPYDIQASKVHTQALEKMHLLTPEEVQTLHKGLEDIATLHAAGNFPITQAQEDGHTAIEEYLTAHYGEVGQKIHTARSRNDQVLTAVRLWQRDTLEDITKALQQLQSAFQTFANTHAGTEMPGYTHTQRAMPTSVEAWAESYAEMLAQCLPLLAAAHGNVNQCPLGSAAGFGTNFPYPREWVAQELSFTKALTVVNTAQNTRLKIDLDFLYALLRVGQVLSHFASEMVLFTTSEFDFFSLDPALTTGSSIMPQKRNLDPAELLRGRYALLWGHFSAMQQLGLNLCSGYHRDFQLGKKAILESAQSVRDMLAIAQAMVEHLTPNTEKMKAACTPELYATEKVNTLVLQGVPFREAYGRVKEELGYLL